MAWIYGGVVTLTNGSKAVAGIGSTWLGNVMEGDQFNTPAGPYEVESVAANGSLQFARPYGGPTISNYEYSIVPTQGRIVPVAKNLSTLLSSVGAMKDDYQGGGIASATEVATRVKKTELAEGTGDGVGTSRAASSTGLTFGKSNLQILVRSAPIDVREALPGAVDPSGQTNYTVQIQKILDYLRDFGGGTLLLPAKMSLLIGMLRIYTGTEIVAPDWTSELITSPDSYGWGISVNPLNGGTSNPDDNQRNIRLAGFSIRGQALVPTFNEHQHLLNMNAVSDLLIENLRIRGHRGDGIYLGSSNTAGLERHNERVTIDRCTIDGVNAENRNGISVIDCSQLVISKVRIVNCTRLGQPGAIDFEPNADLFARIRDVTVEDFYISGGYGSGVACLLRPNATLVTPVTNIKVLKGTIVNKAAGLAYQRNTLAPAVVPRDGVVYSDIEVKNCGTPFLFDSVVGGTLRNVKFSDCTKQAELGYIYGNRDILLDNVTMERCGTAETNGLRIRTIDGLKIDRCNFVDCGRSDVASGRAMYFANGTGANISITNTAITSPTGKTTVNIGVETATYTLNNATCYEAGNTYIVGGQQFVVNGTRGQSVAPTTGNWALGNEVYRTPVAGRPAGWRCIAAGAPAAGTWAPMPLVGGPLRGSSSQRPTKTIMGVLGDTEWAGTQYFDTTLGGALITWTGSVWVNAAGATV